MKRYKPLPRRALVHISEWTPRFRWMTCDKCHMQVRYEPMLGIHRSQFSFAFGETYHWTNWYCRSCAPDADSVRAMNGEMTSGQIADHNRRLLA